jgi:hypothetical protein
MIFTSHAIMRYNKGNEMRKYESRLDVTGDKWNNHNGASRHKAGRLGKEQRRACTRVLFFFFFKVWAIIVA